MLSYICIPLKGQVISVSGVTAPGSRYLPHPSLPPPVARGDGGRPGPGRRQTPRHHAAISADNAVAPVVGERAASHIQRRLITDGAPPRSAPT